jgi:uncharacterized protein YjbI with pentapeptide repeats
MHDETNTANKRCSFQAIYNDLEDGEKFKAWPCPEKTENSKMYCVFHDKSINGWNHEIIVRFAKKINEISKMNDENSELHKDKCKKLMCIGYHFPSNFSFALLDCPSEQHKVIKKDENRRYYNMPIYLCDAEFDGQVEFSYCTFKQSLNLSGAIFRKEVLFRKTELLGQFYPRNTKFYDNVNFWKALFVDADFHDTLFHDKANFREATFKGIKTRFLDVRFQGKAKFENTVFCGETEFRGTIFKEGRFSQNSQFKKFTKFRNVVFENGENTDFAAIDLSNVSFLGTDISRIKFNDDATWNDADDTLTIIDERELKSMNERLLLSWNRIPADCAHRKQLIEFLSTNFDVTIAFDSRFEKVNNIVTIYGEPKSKAKGCALLHTVSIELDSGKMRAKLSIDGKLRHEFSVRNENNEINLYYNHYPPIESVKAIYRGLRENYEYRLRYGEAGEFFVKEMELKRVYNTKQSEVNRKNKIKRLKIPNLKESNLVPPIENNKIIRNLLSLTGWYRILALYGEDLRRPVIAGIVILAMSTFFWLIQINPSAEPSFTSTVGLANATNITVLQKAFERSMTDFLPVLSTPADVKIGLIDFVIKIIGGVVTFGLLAIALRRKFERRFRH